MNKARGIIEEWKMDYTGVRPHSTLGHRPPAPEATMALILA
ncbi:MAG TPA: transposase [Dehalococcoidia bacterium]|nr:transposase [Dehalococcoidia bacterium]